jgi:hypothetical protein
MAFSEFSDFMYLVISLSICFIVRHFAIGGHEDTSRFGKSCYRGFLPTLDHDSTHEDMFLINVLLSGLGFICDC